MTEERIAKWEAEAAKLAEEQKETNRKYNERIRALREKIREAKAAVRENEDRMMAKAVRELFGDMDAGEITEWKEKMAKLAEGGE